MMELVSTKVAFEVLPRIFFSISFELKIVIQAIPRVPLMVHAHVSMSIQGRSLSLDDSNRDPGDGDSEGRQAWPNTNLKNGLCQTQPLSQSADLNENM
jgi:hypothetical protein